MDVLLEISLPLACLLILPVGIYFSRRCGFRWLRATLLGLMVAIVAEATFVLFALALRELRSIAHDKGVENTAVLAVALLAGMVGIMIAVRLTVDKCRNRHSPDSN